MFQQQKDNKNDNDDDSSGELDFIHDIIQILLARQNDDYIYNVTNNDHNDVILEEDDDKGQEPKKYHADCPEGTSSTTAPKQDTVSATDCSNTGSTTSILNDDTDGKDTSTTKKPEKLPIIQKYDDPVPLSVVEESQPQVSFDTNTNNTTTTATTTVVQVRPGAQYVVPSGSVPGTTTNYSNSHTVQQQQQQLNEASTTTTLLHATLINDNIEEQRTAVAARTVITTRGSSMQQQSQNIQHAEPLDDISINDDEESWTTNDENVVGNNNNTNTNRNDRRSKNRRGSDDKRSNKRTTVYCYLLVCLGICIATILIFFVVDPIQQKQEGSTTVGSSTSSSSNNINNTVNDTTTSSTSSSNMFTRHGLIVRYNYYNMLDNCNTVKELPYIFEEQDKEQTTNNDTYFEHTVQIYCGSITSYRFGTTITLEAATTNCDYKSMSSLHCTVPTHKTNSNTSSTGSVGDRMYTDRIKVIYTCTRTLSNDEFNKDTSPISTAIVPTLAGFNCRKNNNINNNNQLSEDSTSSSSGQSEQQEQNEKSSTENDTNNKGTSSNRTGIRSLANISSRIDVVVPYHHVSLTRLCIDSSRQNLISRLTLQRPIKSVSVCRINDSSNSTPKAVGAFPYCEAFGTRGPTTITNTTNTRLETNDINNTNYTTIIPKTQIIDDLLEYKCDPFFNDEGPLNVTLWWDVFETVNSNL